MLNDTDSKEYSMRNGNMNHGKPPVPPYPEPRMGSSCMLIIVGLILPVISVVSWMVTYG